jgi:hypothetical protein
MTNFDPSGGGFGAVGRQLSAGPALDVFSSGPGGIFQAWYNEPDGWSLGPESTPTLVMQPLGAANASQAFPHPPSAVSWAPDRLDLFAVNSAGELWHYWADDEDQPQSSWGDESLGHPPHGPLDSAPAAVVQDVDKITVFARAGSDGALVACVWDPASGQRWAWHTAVQQLGWAPEPGPYAFSPTACSWDPSRIDLFAITGNTNDGGTLEHTWQQDFPGAPGWHPDYWEDAATITATSSPVSVSWLDQQQAQQITVVYCGPTDIEVASSVGMTRWLGDHWASDWLFQQVDSDIGVAGFPTLASWQPGRLDVFWLRSDYTLQHGWNANGGDLSDWDWNDVFALQFPGG